MTKQVNGYKFYFMKNDMVSVTAPNGENQKMPKPFAMKLFEKLQKESNVKDDFNKRYVSWFENAVKKLSKGDNSTFYFPMEKKDGLNFAIVVGRSSGYELNEDNFVDSYSGRICAKIAFQKENSMLQCDYDVDWEMWYNEKTGEVDDVEVSLYENDDLEKVALEIMADYKRRYMGKKYKSIFA